jgi:ABC-type glycerol-3-phosphate transport system permease component
VFARLRFPGRDILFGIVMLTALIPLDVLMIPLYIVIRSLDLQSTYWALFLPWIANPFGIFLLRQAFIEIPRDLDEAALVDGASLYQVFWHVILPNSRAALATLALMSFLWSWNAFLWPLIVMQDANKQVVQVAIATFTIPQELPAWGQIFAASSVATVPILIVFIALQRYYIRGVVISGMK